MTESPITPLGRPVSNRLRSALIIPSLPQILNELVQNSLDAGCKRVECHLDLSRGNECIRVEDDGHGLDLAGLKRVGERNASSKKRTDAAITPLAGYGFRGEALSSIAALGQLEITTKTTASRYTYTKVFRASRVMAMGKSNRAIVGSQGTTVSVKDIYHKIPVRQAALASTPTSTTITGCKRVIETLALVHAGVKFTLWEERYAGPSTMNEPKKILGIGPGRASIDVYKAIYGSALVEKVQSIRVSAGTKRLDGFISLQGSLSRSNQHLYTNKFTLERGELHTAISKRFANSRFSYMTQDDVESTADHRDRRRSPRRLERHPIYVLNITIPPEEIDASYGPRKNSVGYKDESSVQTFVLAVVDEFLKRHGFATDKHRTNAISAPSASPSRSVKGANTAAKPARPSRPASDKQYLTQHFSQSVDRTMPSPFTLSRKRSAIEETSRTPSTEVHRQEGRLGGPGTKRKRETWLDDLRANTNTGVLPVTPDQLRSFLSTPISLPSATLHRHRCSLYGDSPHLPTTDIRFKAESLNSATIIGQVDKKFIACLINSDDTGTEQSLVLIDQHAADERVAVEDILRELCEGFPNDSVRQATLVETHIILTRYEADRLSDPAVLDVFSRWGITLVPPSSANSATATYVQVAVTTVPAVLAYRLARKETSELTRLVRHYLTVLPDLLPQIRATTSFDQQDCQLVQRWMPKEMLELANSKACRNAIMFEDTLDQDQCRRLVARLATTRSPWICAHGRPSLVPLGTVPNTTSGKGAEGRSAIQRGIDWTAWAADA